MHAFCESVLLKASICLVMPSFKQKSFISSMYLSPFSTDTSYRESKSCGLVKINTNTPDLHHC